MKRRVPQACFKYPTCSGVGCSRIRWAVLWTCGLLSLLSIIGCPDCLLDHFLGRAQSVEALREDLHDRQEVLYYLVLWRDGITIDNEHLGPMSRTERRQPVESKP